MHNEIEKKIDSYIGLSVRSGSLFVGKKLEEMIAKKKISLVVILPSCPTKTKQHLLNSIQSIPCIEYKGTFNLAISCGYESLNAFGISDKNLASVLKEHLMTKEDTK